MIQIRCQHQEMIPISQCIPHIKNRNKHPKEQIERLTFLIKHHGFRHPIIISKLSGMVVAGHGRLEAAAQLSMDKVPVDYQEFENEEQEYAFLVSDNSIALWAELDLSSILLDIKSLPDLDIDLLGIHPDFLEEEKKTEEETSLYTDKIKSPIYEPKGPKPLLSALYHLDKVNQLKKEIEDSDISEDLKVFLTFAAYRHVVFHYQNIAEYYSHSSEAEQILMEKSALVIIDFNQAIENGFVKVTQDLAEAYDSQA